MVEIVNFIDLDENEKVNVLNWRNHKDIRKWMLNKKVISFQEHLEYLQNLANRKDKKVFLIKNMGVVEFSNIKNQIAVFGINKNIESSEKGLGKQLLEIGFSLAEKLNLKKLELFVYKKNLKALNLYQSGSFKIIKEDKEFYYMEKIL
jgi:UDP-4-amino-4,6-dideoxy-N-acetyl-beta-L-altrosamine N-acetyltransferase